MIQDNLKLVDVVIELVDARLPLSSRNPDVDKIIGSKPRIVVLNKADIADNSLTIKWLNYFKDKNIDVLITVGELSKNIAAGVRTVSVCDVHSYDTKDELEKDFSKLLKKGDNILVKASHGMQFTKIVDFLEKLEL